MIFTSKFSLYLIHFENTFLFFEQQVHMQRCVLILVV